MAGIYIHIPFCKQACHYCDFHFSVNQSRRPEVIDAILRELKLQCHYLGSEQINTIYFGGGTPSLLDFSELQSIMDSIHLLFKVAPAPEVTLEANPDDLNLQKLKDLKNVGVNRLSIGVQSFNTEVLTYLNRAHNAQEAIQCIKNARKAGFDNISIDLIYGIPSENHKNWYSDLEKIIKLAPEHISSYCLTIEPQTAFGRKLDKGDLTVADDDFSAEQFEILLDVLSNNNYMQYEISNFSKNGLQSQHNSNYWKREKYLGIGPSAHSYNGHTRQFNINHNQKYIRSIGKDIIPAEIEVLTKEDNINEYILTNLRTSWGLDVNKIMEMWEYDILSEQQTYIQGLFKRQLAIMQGQSLILTKAGKLLADKISSDLFIINSNGNNNDT